MTSVPTPTDVWFLTPPGVTSVPPAPPADTAPATIPANSAPVDASFDPANVDTAQIFDEILPQTPTTAVYLKSRNSGNLLPTNTTRHNIKAALRCVCIILSSRYDLTPKFTNTTLATKTPLALYRLKAQLNCASAAYTLSSAAVELIRKYSIAVTVASFTLLGQTASLTGPAVKTLTAIGGQFYVNRELQVLLLSHFDSELDEQTGNTVGYNWRGTTSPAIVANSKFGGGAVQCDNTFYSDLYLYTYLNSVIVPQDIPVWTLEAWTYITSSDSTCPLGFTADGNPDGIGYLIWLSSYEDAGSNFAILSFDYFNGSVYETMLYGEVPVSTVTGWCHVALCFTGTAYRIYLNGSIVADYTTGETEIPFKYTVGNVQNPINVKSPLVFGEPPLTIGGVLGWGAYDTIVDEVRLVEGLVSNTGTFPVPTEAYTTEALGVIDTKLSKLYSSNLSVGVFTLTGQSVDLPSPTKVTKAVVGTFTLVGQTTALSKTSSVMSAVTGVYTLQGGDTSDIPSYIGYTNGATTTVDLNIAWPSGYAAGDLGVIITESSSTNASSRAITPPYGWSLLTGWPLDDTTSYCSIFYKIASSSESNVFLHRIADHQIAVLSVFRGVDPDNPFVTAEGSVTSVAGSAVSYPSVTGVIPRTLLVECRTNSQDTTTTETDSGRTNANSAWSDLGLIRAYNTGNGDGGGITIYQAKTSAQISSGLPGTTATSTRSVGLRTLGTLVLRPKWWTAS